MSFGNPSNAGSSSPSRTTPTPRAGKCDATGEATGEARLGDWGADADADAEAEVDEAVDFLEEDLEDLDSLWAGAASCGLG